jgi:ABC-type uncharacterized transport system involved in gliding motility auxiliary subunit
MVSIITPFEMALDVPVSASLSVMAILLLIILMVLKELASTSERRWQALGRFLNIAIVPLLITFFITVTTRIADVLRELDLLR